MAGQPSEGGLIATLEGKTAPSLRRIARTYSMRVLETQAADQAFDMVCRRFPPVIIVQVGGAITEVLKFLRLATTASWRIRLIAAATRHSIGVERAVLRGGAHYYLPGLRERSVERLLAAVLREDRRRARSSEERTWRQCLPPEPEDRCLLNVLSAAS